MNERWLWAQSRFEGAYGLKGGGTCSPEHRATPALLFSDQVDDVCPWGHNQKKYLTMLLLRICFTEAHRIEARTLSHCSRVDKDLLLLTVLSLTATQTYLSMTVFTRSCTQPTRYNKPPPLIATAHVLASLLLGRERCIHAPQKCRSR